MNRTQGVFTPGYTNGGKRRTYRKNDKRTETLKIRIGQTELCWLKLEAHKAGKTVSAYVLEKVLGEIEDTTLGQLNDELCPNSCVTWDADLKAWVPAPRQTRLF